MKPHLLLAYLLFILASAAGALQPYRVADVNPIFHSGGSDPEQFVRVGRRALFTAKTPDLGLWSSDGSSAGTRRILANVTSVYYGVATGEVLYFTSCVQTTCQMRVTDGTVAGTRVLPAVAYSSTVAIVGGRRILFGGRSAEGTGLFTSDGTPGGTRLVKRFDGLTLDHFVWSRDRLWFFAGDTLWISDGKTAGTRKVAKVGSVYQAGAAGTRLVFFVRLGDTTDARLWSSDGTAQGTKPLGVVAHSAEDLVPFATAGGKAYFLTIQEAPPSLQSMIWATDGTAAQTRKLATFDQFTANASPPVAVGSRAAFVASNQLWVSDGRPGGTRPLANCPGTCPSLGEIGAVDGERIWFSGYSPPGDVPQLWVSDLTPSGTRRVSDLERGDVQNFIVGDGRVYFEIFDFGEQSLWASDGTPGGTRPVVQQAFADRPIHLSAGAVVEGRGFFRVIDESHGLEPWVSDGTVAGTNLIKDLVTTQDGGSFPMKLTAVGDRCFFFPTFDNGDTNELWVSDGTAAGTSLAYSFGESFDTGDFGFTTVGVGNRFAWYRPTGGFGGELWMSDGTQSGTGPIHPPDVRALGTMRAVAGRLFFQATDGDHGDELWVSDGGPAVRLSDFPRSSPFPESFHFVRLGFVEVAGGVSFLVADELGHFESWFSDGTIGGTRHLADAYPALVDPFSNLAGEVVSAGGKSYFIGGEGTPTFWVTDLTVAGTRSLGPVVTRGGDPAFPYRLAALGNRALLFYSAPQEHGFWVSDGTGMSPGAGGLPPIDPVFDAVPFGNKLAFRGDSQQGDSALYVTDGTAAGTTRVTDRDGNGFGPTWNFAGLGNRLAVVAFSGVWEIDGTPAGTVRRLAPYPGVEPRPLVPVGQRIFFPWFDKQHGTELWALRP